MTRFLRRFSIAAACATLVALAWRSWYTCDDAHISFRYARNVAEGLGLRFNLEDPPIEGFSNPVWVLVAALVRTVGLDETRVIPGISIFLAVVALLVTTRFVARLEPTRPWLPVGAAWLLAANSAFANWATSGLETMQWACTLLLAFLAWIYEANPVLRGALLVLMVGSRPEGIAWAGVFVGLGALRHPASWRKLAIAAGIAATGIAILLLGRYAIFGDWVANTAHAKGGNSAAYYVRGLRYVLLNSWETVLPLVGLPLALYQVTRWRPRAPIAPLTAVGVVVLGHAALAIAVGGDYMPFGRFLLGSQALLAVLIITAVGRLPSPVAAVVVTGLAGASTLPQFDVSLVSEQGRVLLDFRQLANVRATEREVWWAEKTRALAWGEQGRYLRRALAEDERVASVAIGAMGYYSHRYIVDSCYLVARIPPGVEIPRGKKSPGHDSCIRKLSQQELFDQRVIGGWGTIRVAEHGRAENVWTVLLPSGVIRTFYAIKDWEPTAAADQFFYVDRFRAPYYTPQEGK